MVDISLKCKCGAVEGQIRDVSANSGTRAVCHCKDCQAFAHYLGRADDILTKEGGTEVYQIYPCQLQITKGEAQLHSMRLTPKGLLRWYTDCCKTPVGSTIASHVAFIGVNHLLINDKAALEQTCGPVRYYVQGQYASGKPAGVTLSEKFPLKLIVRTIVKLLLGRLRGKARPNVLFQANGKPISKPVIVSTQP